jgi:hypothetical protein
MIKIEGVGLDPFPKEIGTIGRVGHCDYILTLIQQPLGYVFTGVTEGTCYRVGRAVSHLR